MLHPGCQTSSYILPCYFSRSTLYYALSCPPVRLSPSTSEEFVFLDTKTSRSSYSGLLLAPSTSLAQPSPFIPQTRHLITHFYQWCVRSTIIDYSTLVHVHIASRHRGSFSIESLNSHEMPSRKIIFASMTTVLFHFYLLFLVIGSLSHIRSLLTYLSGSYARDYVPRNILGTLYPCLLASI